MLFKRYKWYEINIEGQLIEPFVNLQFCRCDYIDNNGEFDTEEEAVKSYEKFIERNGFRSPSKLVLLTTYSTY